MTSLRDADAGNSRFVNTRMEGSVFDDVNLRHASFTNVNPAGAALSNVNLTDVSISDANVSGLRINGVLVSRILAAQRQPATAVLYARSLPVLAASPRPPLLRSRGQACR